MQRAGVEQIVKQVCLLGAFLALSPILHCPDMQATEGGGGAYLNGAEGFLAGALPPPGWYYLNYLVHYSADRLNDGNGNEAPIDFQLDVTANASRFLYMSDKALLGGTLGAHALISLMHASVDTSLGDDTKSGVGDLTVGPVLAWHFSKQLHAAAGLDITAPVGAYDEQDLANLGRNYWTVEPIFAVTWMADNGLEASAKFMYDFNTENTDTEYTSGQEFHFDYGVGYQINAWKIGAQGYYYKQITDDDGPGADANDGNKGLVFAVGPAVKYDFKSGGFIELKYVKEMEAENRPEGDKLLCKLVVPF